MATGATPSSTVPAFERVVTNLLYRAFPPKLTGGTTLLVEDAFAKTTSPPPRVCLCWLDSDSRRILALTNGRCVSRHQATFVSGCFAYAASGPYLGQVVAGEMDSRTWGRDYAIIHVHPNVNYKPRMIGDEEVRAILTSDQVRRETRYDTEHPSTAVCVGGQPGFGILSMGEGPLMFGGDLSAFRNGPFMVIVGATATGSAEYAPAPGDPCRFGSPSQTARSSTCSWGWYTAPRVLLKTRSSRCSSWRSWTTSCSRLRG